MKISVVTTVLNDRDGMEALLESLKIQSEPFEIVIVDAGSTDGTVELIQEAQRSLNINFIQKPGPRGEGFRTACAHATGDVLAFIGADDVADSHWVESIRNAFSNNALNIGVGINHLRGKGPKVQRIPWVVDGHDISHPGCNTMYRTSVYHEIGGIDASFVTAEDMEMNLRAIQNGYTINEIPEAVVHRTVRPTRHLMKQSYWNGFGRGQLIAKHGDLPGMASGAIRSVIRFWNIPRLIAGYLGYRAGRRGSA